MGAVVYLNSLPALFHLDDFPHLVENPKIKQGLGLGPLWEHWPTRCFGFWTFALNYSIARLDPATFRLVNLFIHLLGGGVFYLLIERLARSSGYPRPRAAWVAFWSGLIFVCHPVQTQAVTYIVQRLASLAGVLLLVALLGYLWARSGRRGDSPRSLLGAGLAYLVGWLAALGAMLTKESAVVLPVLLFGVEWLVRQGERRRGEEGRWWWRGWLPYVLTALVVPALSLYIAGGRGSHPFYYQTNLLGGGRMYVVAQNAHIPTRLHYLYTQLHGLLTYLRLALLPVQQSIYYDFPLARSLYSPGPYFALLLLAALILMGLSLLRSQPLIGLGIFWFFLHLLPTSSVLVLWPLISEHHLYLALGAPALLLGLLLAGVGGREGERMRLAGWFLVFCLALLTIRRNRLWNRTLDLWEDALQRAPAAANVYNALAGALVEEKRYQRAEVCARRALELNPQLNAYHNLWAASFNRGDLDQAETVALQHRHLFGADLQGGVNLAMTYLKGGDLASAHQVLTETVSAHPDSAPARYWLGLALDGLGEGRAAAAELEAAVRLNPDFSPGWDQLGRIYADQGEVERALVVYRRGVKIHPDSLILNYNLGMLAWREGQLALAQRHLAQAARLAQGTELEESLATAYSKLLASSSSQ